MILNWILFVEWSFENYYYYYLYLNQNVEDKPMITNVVYIIITALGIKIKLIAKRLQS